MYKTPEFEISSMEVLNTKTGETIENKVKRLVENKEPIKDGAPIIYTERKDGVDPAHNIRTDRWEIATDMMTRLLKTKEAKREELAKVPTDKEGKVIQMEIGKTEPTHDKTALK